MDSAAKERDTRSRQQDELRAEATTRRVGIGVILARDGEVLLGLRRGSHGAGTWSCPGGHLDHGESAEACASRELREETGLEAADALVVAETIDDFPEGLRYRTLFVRVDWAGGEPALREPDACERWGWFSWDALPTPLFLSVANLRATRFRP
jgi:8-oxo-dGTP diphosphatase